MASPLRTSVDLDVIVNEVAAVTGVSDRVEVEHGWRHGQIDYQTGLIADGKAIKADLGLASSRAFARSGALSLGH
jgi:hypothetical protein